MRVRPIVVLSSAVVLLAGATAPVLAAAGDPADAPATGSASSTLTLLDVAVGGTRLDVLELALGSERTGDVSSTSVVVTPLSVDGTAYGQQTVGTQSAALPAADSARLAPAAVTALAAARTPAVDVVSDGGTSRVGAASLGGVSLLGIPLDLDGHVEITTSVADAGATSSKTLTVTGLALPSVADLLAAQGLDLRALPTGTLTELLRRLRLDTPLTRDADAALQSALAAVALQVAAAEAAVAATSRAVSDAGSALASAEVAVAPAASTLNEATAALEGASGSADAGSVGGAAVASLLAPGVVDAVPPVVDAVPDVDKTLGAVTAPPPVVEAPAPTLPPVVLPLPELPAVPDADLQPLVDAYVAAKQAYDDAVAAVVEARAVLAVVQQALTDAQKALDALLVPVTAQLDALLDAVTGVLDATPLVALDRLQVTTRSGATSAAAGGQTAQVVGGRVEGLRVLGTDVLDAALGSSGVDVTQLTGGATAPVDAVVADLTGGLGALLSAVPGLPGLVVPAPTVSVLRSATATDVVDGFGIAGTALRALTVTWPGIAVPAAAALAGADALPAVTGLLPAVVRPSGVGDVVSQGLTLGVATLEDRVRFRPAQLSAAPDATDDGATADGPDAPVEAGPDGSAPAAPDAPVQAAPDGSAPAAPDTPVEAAPLSPDAAQSEAAEAGTSDAGAPPPVTAALPRTTAVALTELPRTGSDSVPAALALLLVAAALVLHRRIRTT